MTLLDLLILSLVTYRITRFLQLDSLIDEPRNYVAGWLDIDPKPWWRRKLLQLIECPFCESVWVAGFALWYWAAISDYTIGWHYITDWLAVSAGGMVIYRVVDPPPTK